MSKAPNVTLRELAKLFGVQIAYNDVFKRRHSLTTETLIAVLQSLGVPLANQHEATDFLREEHIRRGKRALQPITLAINGELSHLTIHLPEHLVNHSLHCSLILESGENQICAPKKQLILDRYKIEGNDYLAIQLQFIQTLPYGYHQLAIECQELIFTTQIIAAPAIAYTKPHANTQRNWGIFTPLYALHSTHSFGAGDFKDLNQLIHWLSAQGGNLIGTLPLFSGFLHEPSPYSPISKLFFNEFYLDVTQIAEFQNCAAAQKLFSAGDFQHGLQTIRQLPLTDYEKITVLKRQILEMLTQYFFEFASSQRQFAFRQFCQQYPNVEDYAAFRAVHEKISQPWIQWPAQLQAGTIEDSDYAQSVKNYYLYTQWQTHEQLKQVAHQAQQRQVNLYLDMPLGVHPHGYDTWRQRDLFALNLSVGAPPDAVFTEGQNWGFPPLISHQLRETGYQYFIQSLRTVLPYVNLLRLDHVMALHRLYCIPAHHEAKNGAFIRYPAEEFYAILCLESQRHQVCIVGENLGTVPKYVNQALSKYRLYTMHVVQYELSPLRNEPVDPSLIPARSVASLNTHDMPPFAAFAQGLDIKGSKNAVHQEWQRRKSINPKSKTQLPNSELQRLLQECLFKLSMSRSHFLLINLEDLWLETNPQNIPVSGNRYPNWQRRTRLNFEQWSQDNFLCATLNHIKHLRSKGLKPKQ